MDLCANASSSLNQAGAVNPLPSFPPPGRQPHLFLPSRSPTSQLLTPPFSLSPSSSSATPSLCNPIGDGDFGQNKPANALLLLLVLVSFFAGLGEYESNEKIDEP